jgi:hypothetical protein
VLCIYFNKNGLGNILGDLKKLIWSPWLGVWMDVLQILTSFSGVPQLLQNQTGAPPKLSFSAELEFFSKKYIFGAKANFF